METATGTTAAARATVTATSRRRPGRAGWLATSAVAGMITLGFAGCGSTGSTRTASHAQRVRPGTAFSWFAPAPAPAGWPRARMPAGGSISYPPGWRTIPGDPGTASVALIAGRHDYLGYLNLTPREGAETLATWGRFRAAHNQEEGSTHVVTQAVLTGASFGTARGSCVRDAYASTTGVRYSEIACLLQGRRGAEVVVGAAPPSRWRRMAPLLERAISTAELP